MHNLYHHKNLPPKAFIAEGIYPFYPFITFIVQPLSPKAFIIAFIFVMASVQAQTDMTTTLQRIEQEVASGNLNESEMFTKYDSLIRFYSTRDLDKTIIYFHKGTDFARIKNLVEWEAKYWRRMGYIYYHLGERDSVLIYLDKALKLIENKEYYNEEMVNYEVRGYYYGMLSEYEKAMSAYFKAIELNEKDINRKIALNQSIDQNIGFGINLNNLIAGIYYDLRNLGKTEEYLLLSKKIIDENRQITNLSYYENIVVGNLGQIYTEMGRMKEVLPLLLRSYELATESADLYAVVYALQRLSNFYRTEQKDLNQALKYAKEALQIAEQTKQIILLNRADEAMMEVYHELQDYKTALWHAERIAARTPDDDWDGLQNLYKGLILIYASLGNTDKTKEYLNRLDELIVKISDKNLHNALQEMTIKYDVKQKELEIERQQAEIDRRRTQQFLFVGSLIAAGLLLSLLTYIVALRTRRNRALTERNDALAETNALKDKFFSIISHDLRNPVVTQRDSLKLLAANADKLDANTLTDYLHDTHKLADGLVDLLAYLLDWSKVQTGRMEYKPSSFNLVAALQPDIGVVKSMATHKNITFDTLTPPRASVTADENMLKTVIRNLLTNAVKFTEAGGKVVLKIESGELRMENGDKIDKGVVVSVSDDGVGMTQEQLQNLFRIDRQQTSIGTAGEQSSGLGLIVCRDMLEKHGSELKVKSEKGKGSKFWFEITLFF